MADRNKNLVPDTIDRVVQRVGAILTSLLGVVVTYLGQLRIPVPLWLGIVAIGLPIVLTYFAFKEQP